MSDQQVATGHPATPAGHNNAPTRIVNEYLDTFYGGDFTRARALVADDFAFQGPFLHVQGAEAFFAGAAGLKQIVRGHELLRQWDDGGHVCSIYDVNLATPLGTGTITMSEWHTVTDQKLVAARVLFDTIPFRELLPSAP
jgi:hypothetical protein